jgi:hypothetical protein
MTAGQVLAWIGAALLLQLAVGIGVVAWRRQGAVVAMSATMGVETPQASAGAWPGQREFRVALREYADGAHSQCSFHLEPVDGMPLPPFRPGQFLTFALEIAGAGAGS